MLQRSLSVNFRIVAWSVEICHSFSWIWKFWEFQEMQGLSSAYGFIWRHFTPNVPTSKSIPSCIWLMSKSVACFGNLRQVHIFFGNRRQSSATLWYETGTSYLWSRSANVGNLRQPYDMKQEHFLSIIAFGKRRQSSAVFGNLTIWNRNILSMITFGKRRQSSAIFGNFMIWNRNISYL